MNYIQIISILIFAVTMLLIMTEKLHRMTAALAGAVATIILGVLDIETGIKYIDGETICILVGMMLTVSVIRKSGLFEFLAIKSAKLARGKPWAIMVAFMLITAFLSAFLDNVTTVLLVGPMLFAITKALGVNPIPYVISTIIASNIGGTGTLIGDPPNIMIGSAANLSFMDFIANTGPAVLVVLLATIVCFYFLYGRKEKVSEENVKKLMNMDEKLQIKDKKLMIKSVALLALMILAFILQDYIGLKSAVIALGSATVMLIIGRQDIDQVVEGVEWTTIVFFIGLFIVVGGLQETGVVNMLANVIIDLTKDNVIMGVIIVLWVSAILSSFLDNIPFVATMIPLITAMGDAGMNVMPFWWALSLGACLGGNGTLIGASANVVLSGISAKEGHPISFKNYMKVGFPLMIISIIICTVYVVLRYS